MLEEASCSRTVTHPSRLVRTCKAVGYSAFYLGKGVKSGVCSSQQREAKSFQILLSLWRTEKHSFLRKHVLKPSAAAMPVVGYLPVTWANSACPGKTVWPHCCFREGGLGGPELSLLCLPSRVPGCPNFPLVQDGPARTLGFLNPFSLRTNTADNSQKDSPASAWHQVPSLTLCSGSALVHRFPPHSLWRSH